MRLILLFTLCSLIFGCAGTHSSNNSNTSNNWVHFYRAGIQIKDTENGILVLPFAQNIQSPAKDAGVQPGDIIKTLNGKQVLTKEFINMMNSNAGEDIHIEAYRNGQLIHFDITPKMESMAPSIWEIRKILGSKKKVHAAVIVTSIKNNTPWAVQNYSLVPSWEESIHQECQSIYETSLLNNFKWDTSFALIDRSNIDKIIQENNISLSGLVSENELTRIGQMAGVTHLILLSFSRYTNAENGFTDLLIAKLIAIESGKILAVDQDYKKHS